jgi:hypothetical protein
MKTEYIKSHYYKLKEGLSELAEFLNLSPKDVWSQFETIAKENPKAFIKYMSWADSEWEKMFQIPLTKNRY